MPGEMVDPQAVILREIADERLKRDDVAVTYARCLQQPDGVDFAAVNAAIVGRWSDFGLWYVQNQARKRVEDPVVPTEASTARAEIEAAGGLVGIREICEAAGIPYGSRGNARTLLDGYQIRPVAHLASGPVYLRAEVDPLIEGRRRARRDAAGRTLVARAPA